MKHHSSALYWAVLAAVGGAAAMYFLDPTQGRRRRAQVRDKAYSVAHHSAKSLNGTSRHLRNKARGLGAELRHLVPGMAHRDKAHHAASESVRG